VAELMILANARWGRLLADHRVPGIYRIQPPGTRVRMATHAAPHAGLGVAQYAWCTSPLRRYVDLVNQRQVIAVLSGRTPPYTGSDSDLFAVLSAFDAKYEAYADFQSRMERWWCLRWLQQEGLTRVEAVVTRDDMARLCHAPLVLRVTGMPMLAPGRRIVIDLVEQDELDLTIHARFVEVDGEGVDVPAEDGLDAEGDSEADAEADAEVQSKLVGAYGVIGNPIAHSRSPSIHAAFAVATGQAIVYERILAPADGFVATVDAFRAQGGRGLNVTLPFKQDAYAYATERTPRAQAAGAVNTLVFGPDGVLGDNTDGIGLLRDLARLGVTVAEASVLVLGAGGAARGALAALLDSGCARLTVANRTPERAVALAADPLLAGVEAVTIEALESLTVDIVINATSGGLQWELLAVPDTLLRSARLAYDMVYAAHPTPFVQQAQAAGCPLCVDGLGMLVEQAAESFRVWRGVMPDTEPVLQAMRAELAGSLGA
jgi:shikimate dehydrogenase